MTIWECESKLCYLNEGLNTCKASINIEHHFIWTEGGNTNLTPLMVFYALFIWIMYLMGGLDRHVDRYIARYIGRYSTEYRSIFDRVQVDISVEYRPMYRPILLSVDILGDSPILDRYLTDT